MNQGDDAEHFDQKLDFISRSSEVYQQAFLVLTPQLNNIERGLIIRLSSQIGGRDWILSLPDKATVRWPPLVRGELLRAFFRKMDCTAHVTFTGADY